MILSNKHFRYVTGIALLVYLVCPEVNAEVYRCVDSTGRIEYRATRCEVDSHGQSLSIGRAQLGGEQISSGKAVPSGLRRDTYTLGSNALLVMDKDSGKTSSVPLPTSFPSFSWPTGVAYDTDLDIVTVVTLGGEGFLYRYDAKRKQWLDYRSMKGIDVKSLAYDGQSKLYVARTSDGEVLSISNQGNVIDSKPRIPNGRTTRDIATSRLGPPSTPVNNPQLPMRRQTPARELAANSELVVVSGYEASPGVTRVLLNRPGKRVLLVLSSYDKILWRV